MEKEEEVEKVVDNQPWKKKNRIDWLTVPYDDELDMNNIKSKKMWTNIRSESAAMSFCYSPSTRLSSTWIMNGLP